MSKITPVDAQTHMFAIHRDLSVSAEEHRPGPPERIDGVSVGIITMHESAPHGGEVHPDGDEVLYVISGKLLVTGESEPDKPLELTSGQACIVTAGEWHKVDVLETTQLIYFTPGPNGNHRPLG